MQDGGRGVASSSAAPAQRQVLYRKYDPAKSRRLSQLSSLNGSGSIDGQSHSNSTAPPTRVLGTRTGSIGSSAAINVPASHNQGDAGIPMAAESTSKSGHDYFVRQHSDSTAPSLAIRQSERERLEQSRQNSYSSSGSSNESSSRHVGIDVSAPRHSHDSSNGHVPNGIHPGGPTSSTLMSHNGHASLQGEEPQRSRTQLPTSPIQGTNNGAAVNLPRSQSAMASLQRQDSTSSRHSGFKQFIPPSAYAATGSSAASSPGQLPADGNSIIKPRMSAHLSSAFARGLSNVNGILEGNTPVRLPQSASTVASAVWNKLPPAVQQLKNEIAWDWDVEDHNSSHRSGPDRGLTRSPPQGVRSLSSGAAEFSIDRLHEDRRPSSSASRVSNNMLSGTSSPMLSGPATPNLADQATHPTSLRLADQLRLDYANKQVSSKSSSSVVSSPVQKGKQPYRSGYQPKNGVWRDRTDEFLDFRSRRSVRGAGDSNIILHEERLYRRLEKLVDLHFPPPVIPIDVDKSALSGDPKLATGEKADTTATEKSSLSLKPADMFSRVLRGIAKSNPPKTLSASALRSADQSIVKWQNDNEASNCPICGAIFNVVTRKHHCRLCGRVVCFLPPNIETLAVPSKPTTAIDEVPPTIMPTRSARCSTFILYERFPSTGSSRSLLGAPSTASGHDALLAAGSLREVDLGDFPSTLNFANLTPQERDLVEAELDSKRAREVKAGVRVCRECLNTVMKRQKKSQPKRTETWLRLYNALMELQQDIETSLPLLSELRSIPEPTVESVKQFNTTRKTLLKSLTSYDLLAKRIRDLPAAAGSPLSPPLRLGSGSVGDSVANTLSSSQDRLQKAIYNKAMLFLGEKMAIIKGMGGLTVKLKAPVIDPAKAGREQALLAAQAKLEKEQDEKEQEEKMARLAVLYEQEALVSGYLDDASARRQFEDASALKASLDDLRAEIQNLLQ